MNNKINLKIFLETVDGMDIYADNFIVDNFSTPELSQRTVYNIKNYTYYPTGEVVNDSFNVEFYDSTSLDGYRFFKQWIESFCGGNYSKRDIFIEYKIKTVDDFNKLAVFEFKNCFPIKLQLSTISMENLLEDYIHYNVDFSFEKYTVSLKPL